MTHERAFALVCEICPNQAGMLWDTTDHTACGTAWAVADQYGDPEEYDARAALRLLASGRMPSGWEPAHAREVSSGSRDDADRRKIMTLRPWTFLGESFLPCEWKDSRDAGAKWYAVVYHHTGMQLDERHSPRFATKEDARSWAKDRRDQTDAAEYFAANCKDN